MSLIYCNAFHVFSFFRPFFESRLAKANTFWGLARLQCSEGADAHATLNAVEEGAAHKAW